MGFFDNLLIEFEKNPEIKTAFGEHIHWGYWENPEQADGSLFDFAKAAEQLSRQVLALADLKPHTSVLDAGCGWGGTIALANQLYRDLILTGINIDAEQIQQARQNHQAINGNELNFWVGDACALPERLTALDVAWALECIFAFPSREIFFQQLHSKLKERGKLIVVDFLIADKISELWAFWEPKLMTHLILNAYGEKASNRVQFISFKDYQHLAQKTGYQLIQRQDITRNVQPTYPAIAPKIIRSWGDWIAVRGLEIFSQRHWITYEILVFEKVE
ncbi:SAM-dependent methyltransferase [Planktothricoides raciborskii]|uniref:Methyltransferase domain-containing protein n=1 Tax=Planktothricoides raciborskii FACHB-1370 TaxID=2949576 RepID=A0ABR8EI39_9CYAN|nr:class I SAM-dependent methyltransferase [Planktothricoides raciborskii]MBD2546529.1 methyltransferase domain-containing protein [Planktothricoides raciborskii FACHB-1370]MBD2580693.1 methyltransferase domain-containing protein [Planktothricoides raciborskii FACHB-1261]